MTSGSYNIVYTVPAIMPGSYMLATNGSDNFLCSTG